MLSKRVRDKVWARADGHCEKCGGFGDWRRWLEYAHKEHRGMGGRKGKMKALIDSEENIDLLCAYCHDVRDGRVKE